MEAPLSSWSHPCLHTGLQPIQQSTLHTPLTLSFIRCVSAQAIACTEPPAVPQGTATKHSTHMFNSPDLTPACSAELIRHGSLPSAPWSSGRSPAPPCSATVLWLLLPVGGAPRQPRACPHVTQLCSPWRQVLSLHLEAPTHPALCPLLTLSSLSSMQPGRTASLRYPRL